MFPCFVSDVQEGRSFACAVAARYGDRSRGGARGTRQSDRGRGRAEGVQGAQGGGRSDQRVADRHSAALLANAHADRLGEELDDRVSNTARDALVFGQQVSRLFQIQSLTHLTSQQF